MSDRILGFDTNAGRPAKLEAYALKPMVGYCVDCGTWDAHGRFCSACGYDFTPTDEAASQQIGVL